MNTQTLRGGHIVDVPAGEVTWDTAGDEMAAHRSADATREALGRILTVGEVTARGYRFVGTVQNALMGDLGWAHLSRGERIGLVNELGEITGNQGRAYGRLMERLAAAEWMWQMNRDEALRRRPLEVG